MKNTPITEEQLEQHRIEANGKGFFLKNKYSNRRQKRIQEKWMAKNAKRIAYAEKVKDEKRKAKLEEELKDVSGVYTKVSIWVSILKFFKKLFK